MTRITLTGLLASAFLSAREATDTTEPPAGPATIARADGDTLVLRSGERVRLLQATAARTLRTCPPRSRTRGE